MLPAIVGEAIGGFALASVIVALAALLARARSQRADAERTIAFERELASDLLEQADALDRLVVAVAGLWPTTSTSNACSTASRAPPASCCTPTPRSSSS